MDTPYYINPKPIKTKSVRWVRDRVISSSNMTINISKSSAFAPFFPKEKRCITVN